MIIIGWKGMSVLTSKNIQDAIRNYNITDDFIERGYINPIFSDDKMTLEYLNELLPLIDEYVLSYILKKILMNGYIWLLLTQFL